MSALRRTIIHCDKPGCQEIAYGPSAERVREAAKGTGWRVNVDTWGRTRHDYCPEHA